MQGIATKSMKTHPYGCRTLDLDESMGISANISANRRNQFEVVEVIYPLPSAGCNMDGLAMDSDKKENE